MKKLALAALAVISLLALAAAEASQQEAGTACNPYALESETIQVVGPISCEGRYWVCEFSYFGNKQNAMLAVGMSGDVLPKGSDLLPDLIAAKYASDHGSSYIFGTFLSDSAFAIQLGGMNTSMQNYMNIIRSLRDDDTISTVQSNDLKGRIKDVQELAANLSSKVSELGNVSGRFLESPDCVELMDYLDRMNGTILLAENFSSTWQGFIAGYNSLASGLGDPRISAINPSDAQILGQSLDSLKTAIAQYKKDEEDFVSTVVSNLNTRFEKKESKDKLDEAYAIVRDSNNPNATAKYNEASQAYSEGEYSRAMGLAAEAIALSSIKPPENGTVAAAPADYSVYFIAVGVLLVLILLIVVMRKGGLRDDEGRTKNEDEREGKAADRQKTARKGSWGWVKEDLSSMERHG